MLLISFFHTLLFTVILQLRAPVSIWSKPVEIIANRLDSTDRVIEFEFEGAFMSGCSKLEGNTLFRDVKSI